MHKTLKWVTQSPSADVSWATTATVGYRETDRSRARSSRNRKSNDVGPTHINEHMGNSRLRFSQWGNVYLEYIYQTSQLDCNHVMDEQNVWTVKKNQLHTKGTKCDLERPSAEILICGKVFHNAHTVWSREETRPQEVQLAARMHQPHKNINNNVKNLQGLQWSSNINVLKLKRFEDQQRKIR